LMYRARGPGVEPVMASWRRSATTAPRPPARLTQPSSGR
jgi:hypothetical protein